MRIDPQDLTPPAGWTQAEDGTRLGTGVIVKKDRWIGRHNGDFVVLRRDTHTPDPEQPEQIEVHYVEVVRVPIPAGTEGSDWATQQIPPNAAGVRSISPELLAAMWDLFPSTRQAAEDDGTWGLEISSDAGFTHLIALVQQYLLLESVDSIAVALACIVSAVDEDDDPALWMGIIGSASDAKTEIVRLPERVADEYEGDVTHAGLISRTIKRVKGEDFVIPTGLLMKHHEKRTTTFVFKDFTTMLGSQKKDGDERTAVMNCLREVYDCRYKRTMHEVEIVWEGRLTILMACTHAIDNFTSLSDSLGPRFLFYRHEEQDEDTRDAVMDTVLVRGNSRKARVAAQAQAAAVILRARERMLATPLPMEYHAQIKACVDIINYGRGAVPREAWGKRDIVGLSDHEGPGRVTTQLILLVRALLALQIKPHVIRRILGHVAISSVARVRAKALLALYDADTTVSQRELGRRANVNKDVMGRTLNDLQALGIVSGPGLAGDLTADDTTGWALTQKFRNRLEVALERRLTVST